MSRHHPNIGYCAYGHVPRSFFGGVHTHLMCSINWRQTGKLNAQQQLLKYMAFKAMLRLFFAEQKTPFSYAVVQYALKHKQPVPIDDFGYYVPSEKPL